MEIVMLSDVKKHEFKELCSEIFKRLGYCSVEPVYGRQGMWGDLIMTLPKGEKVAPRKPGIKEKETQDSMPVREWESRIFRRRPGGPAIHEVLQKPSILEFTPTEAWPLGWILVSVDLGKESLKTLYPAVTVGGDFSNVSVLLCPQCGHMLRGLGKGLPVACMECGFPNAEHGWKAVDDGSRTTR